MKVCTKEHIRPCRNAKVGESAVSRGVRENGKKDDHLGLKLPEGDQ